MQPLKSLNVHFIKHKSLNWVRWQHGLLGGINKEPGAGRGQQESLVLTSVHKAVQGAVGRPHQVDQAGLAVADRVWLWNHKGERLGHGTNRFPRPKGPTVATAP